MNGVGVIPADLSIVERQVGVMCVVVKLKMGDEHYDASKCSEMLLQYN